MHGQIYSIVLMGILVGHCQMFMPKKWKISAAGFAEGTIQLVWTQQWHNLITTRELLMMSSLITFWRSWLSRLTILLFVSAASIWFSAVLSMCGSAIASRSQPIACCNRNINSNDITSITKMTSVEITGSVNERMIVVGVMSISC